MAAPAYDPCRLTEQSSAKPAVWTGTLSKSEPQRLLMPPPSAVSGSPQQPDLSQWVSRGAGAGRGGGGGGQNGSSASVSRLGGVEQPYPQPAG